MFLCAWKWSMTEWLEAHTNTNIQAETFGGRHFCSWPETQTLHYQFFEMFLGVFQAVHFLVASVWHRFPEHHIALHCITCMRARTAAIINVSDDSRTCFLIYRCIHCNAINTPSRFYSYNFASHEQKLLLMSKNCFQFYLIFDTFSKYQRAYGFIHSPLRAAPQNRHHHSLLMNIDCT